MMHTVHTLTSWLQHHLVGSVFSKYSALFFPLLFPFPVSSNLSSDFNEEVLRLLPSRMTHGGIFWSDLQSAEWRHLPSTIITVSWCDNTMVMVWLGLGNEHGLGKEPALLGLGCHGYSKKHVVKVREDRGHASKNTALTVGWKQTAVSCPTFCWSALSLYSIVTWLPPLLTSQPLKAFVKWT